jgi:hypothetical protein
MRIGGFALNTQEAENLNFRGLFATSVRPSTADRAAILALAKQAAGVP